MATDRLREALAAAINFRFLPPRPVDDPIWDEIAADLRAALQADAPAPLDLGCPYCGHTVEVHELEGCGAQDCQCEPLTIDAARELLREAAGPRGRGLGEAWADAEAALPEGWMLDELTRLHGAGFKNDAWIAKAIYESHTAGPIQIAVGSTPAEALDELTMKAAALRARAQEGAE